MDGFKKERRKGKKIKGKKKGGKEGKKRERFEKQRKKDLSCCSLLLM